MEEIMAEKKKKSANTLMPSAPAVWAGDAKWRAEEDHRTMTRAGEIKGDKERMRAVKEHNKKMQKNMEKVCK
jgi:hypothetical protein